MAGIYGNSPIDRYYEQLLDDHLDNTVGEDDCEPDFLCYWPDGCDEKEQCVYCKDTQEQDEKYEAENLKT